MASIDNQNNQSDYSDEIEVLTTGINDSPGVLLPKIASITNNYPNPFNSSTTIVYSVANLGPIPAEIEIVIYDVTGRQVRTLVDGKRDIGWHSIIWDGQDDSGDECSTGVYFARISQWGLDILNKPRKLVLMK
ncbi:MAG: T9SS type A sorting domain-containing protein [candidate division Zixibacteria bacterium]|nr:T9SS type A sorting domain-containing protein [candidate division Zixibacteria bacterium]